MKLGNGFREKMRGHHRRVTLTIRHCHQLLGGFRLTAVHIVITPG
ncbi:MAG: hypothetical protein QOF14_130 [Hyphomicrobiales bacterium]|jgi:hypothetical protein|nr:hypothetical protein [Hyphomicrobiales bacterium]